MTLCIFALISTEDPNCIVDLGFVLDASSSVRDDWGILLKFVSDLTRRLNIGPDTSHIGLVTFGDSSRKVFDFDVFKEDPYDEAAILDQISSIPRPRISERTFINRGLRRANQELFQPQFGMRSQVKQVCYSTVAYDQQSAYVNPWFIE